MFATARAVRFDAQMCAARFSEADANADMVLWFEEFCVMQPARVRQKHSAEEILEWFNDMAKSEGKTVRIFDFFLSSADLVRNFAATSDVRGKK